MQILQDSILHLPIFATLTIYIGMNILIIGSGGREHALAWKIKQSPLCDALFIAPGNAGTMALGQNVPLEVHDFEGQKEFAKANNIALIVIGPEDPLVEGIYDYFNGATDWKGIVIGPSKEGAQLEGSKAYSKKFMARHAIPTAAYIEFDASNYQDGVRYIASQPLPIVLKADGLAAGKGVVIAQTTEEALHAFKEMILNRQFGEASSKVVIEQFLDGIEISVFVLTDGKDYQIIGSAKDYKRIGEGDKGLNTGGMGCVSPVPFANEAFMQKVEETIIRPTVNGLHQEGIVYNGFIFFGLIKVNNEPYVIEYNCRMGDPETEVVLPLLRSDLVTLFLDLHAGKLAQSKVEIAPQSAVTIVAVSGGYPEAYEKGKEISLPNDVAPSIIFHAGTKEVNGKILTNGGRVLAVTSYGNNIQDAAARSKKILEKIHFDGINYRRDIGYEFE